MFLKQQFTVILAQLIKGLTSCAVGDWLMLIFHTCFIHTSRDTAFEGCFDCNMRQFHKADHIFTITTQAEHAFDLDGGYNLELRLHVAFKPVPKPVSVEPAWKPQV